MQFRLVASPHNSKGVAVGFLIGPFAPLEKQLREALPDWTIVTTIEKGPSLSRADLDAAFAVSQLPKNSPLIVFGWSAGCQPIRSGLIAGLFGDNLRGVGCFDGTAAAFPKPASGQIEVWARLMQSARDRKVNAVLTCSSMTYTERLPIDPFMATRHVLERALGEIFEPADLEVGKPVDVGSLHVERFDSLDIDTAAHIRQLREVLPSMLPRLAGGVSKPVAPFVASPAAGSSESLGARCVEWCRAEMNTGIKESPPGSNRGARIDQYFDVPDYARGGKPLHVRGLPWCAAAQSMAHHEVGGYALAFVSGLEFETWAKTNGRWREGIYPRVGWLAIFHRGEAGGWERHVARVSEVNGDDFTTIAGNEGDTWKETDHEHGDPTLAGFVEI